MEEGIRGKNEGIGTRGNLGIRSKGRKGRIGGNEGIGGNEHRRGGNEDRLHDG